LLPFWLVAGVWLLPADVVARIVLVEISGLKACVLLANIFSWLGPGESLDVSFADKLILN
jgi:hypothetical protein